MPDGPFTLEALLAAGDLGAELCGKESSIQTLRPAPGSLTDGFARITGLVWVEDFEVGQSEKPLPGRFKAASFGAVLGPIHKLWPNPGNLSEGEESMRGLFGLKFMVFTKSGRRVKMQTKASENR